MVKSIMFLYAGAVILAVAVTTSGANAGGPNQACNPTHFNDNLCILTCTPDAPTCEGYYKTCHCCPRTSSGSGIKGVCLPNNTDFCKSQCNSRNETAYKCSTLAVDGTQVGPPCVCVCNEVLGGSEVGTIY